MKIKRKDLKKLILESLPPWVIDQIKRNEEERRRKERAPLRIPQPQRPEERDPRWREEEEEVRHPRRLQRLQGVEENASSEQLYVYAADRVEQPRSATGRARSRGPQSLNALVACTAAQHWRQS